MFVRFVCPHTSDSHASPFIHPFLIKALSCEKLEGTLSSLLNTSYDNYNTILD